MEKKKIWQSERFADGVLLFTAVVWGAGFTATRQALDAGFGAGATIFLRFLWASLALLVLFFPRIRTITREELKKGAIASILMGIGYLLQAVGMVYTKPSNSAFLSSIYVILVPFLVWLFFKKRPGAKTFVASVICLVGIFILTYSPAGLTFNGGDGITLLCALVFSCHLCYLGRITTDIDPVKLSFLQLAGVAVCALLYSLCTDFTTMFTADWGAGWPAIAYMALFCSCMGLFLQTYGQRHTAPSKVALLLCFESVFGSLFSVLLGFEPLTLHMALGGLIIFSSVLLVESGPGKKAAQPRPENGQ